MSKPFFSIIIPTFNREKFIYKTIQSFISQTFHDFEIIVVDDGGNDQTRLVSESFHDKRISYYWKENNERGAARNYGAARATGDYLNFFDSDDIAYPSHLQTGFNLIKATNSTLAFLGFEFADQAGNSLSKENNFKGDIVRDIINRNKRNLNSVFIKRQAFEEIKFEENRLLAASEDTLLLSRLVARYIPAYVNDITSAMIEHDSRSMVTASEEQLLNRRKFLIEGLKKDSVFMEKYSPNLAEISAEMSYLLCLSSFAAKDKKKAFDYFKEYQKGPSSSYLHKRTLAILKKTLLGV